LFLMSAFHKAASFLMLVAVALPSLSYAVESTPCPTGVLKDGIQQTSTIPATNWPRPTFDMPSASYPNDRLARPFAWERRGDIGLAGSDWVYTDPLGLPGYQDNRPYPNDVGFVRDETGQGRRWVRVPMETPSGNSIEVSCDKPKPPKPPEGGLSAEEPLQISCDKPKPPKPPEDQNTDHFES
jgi:hypothetical protein